MEPIYPLERYKEVEDADEHGTYRRTVERSVNQRLVPIFEALAGDPDGWELERQEGKEWFKSRYGSLFPSRHGTCDDFRLAPKRKRRTISVEIDEPVACAVHGVYSVLVNFATQKDADQALEAICKAMEGK